MTQEGSQEIRRLAFAISDALSTIARAHQDQTRAFRAMAEAIGRLGELSPGYLASDPQLRDAVLPEAAPKPAPDRSFQPPAPREAAPSQSEEPLPWDAFFLMEGILPVHAVQLIRAEIPSALRPANVDEDADWPKVPAEGEPHEIKAATDMELQRAASKLRSLQGETAATAQAMIRRLHAGARPKGRRRT